MSEKYPQEEYNIREAKGADFYKVMIVNTALSNYLYKDEFPWLLVIDIDVKDMQQPYKMPTESESIILNLFEETLSGIIKAHCSSQYVGRVTDNGRRELYYHIDTPRSVHEALQKFMNTGLSSHEFSYDIIRDDNWDKTDFFFVGL